MAKTLSRNSSRHSGISGRDNDLEMSTTPKAQTAAEPLVPNQHWQEEATPVAESYATALQPATSFCIKHPFQTILLFLATEVILFAVGIIVPLTMGTRLGTIGQIGVLIAVGGLVCCVCPVVWILAPLSFLIPEGLLALRKVQVLEAKTDKMMTSVGEFGHKITHIGETFHNIGSNIEDKFSTLGSTIHGQVEVVGEKLSSIGSELGGKFHEIGESVSSKFHDMAGKFEGVERMANNMHDKFDEIESAAVERVREGLTAFEDGVKKDFSGVIDKITEVEDNLTHLLTVAKEKSKDAVDTVKNESHGLLKKIGLEEDDYDGIAGDGHKVLLINEGESHHFDSSGSVRKAWFGASGHDYEFSETHGADVTEKLRSLIEESDGTVVANVDGFGDPAPRWSKNLAVEIRGVKVVIAKEGEVAELPNGRVKRAWYGASGHNWEWGAWRGKDVTERVRQLAEVSNSVLCSTENFGDPAPRWEKELLVEVRVYHPKPGARNTLPSDGKSGD